MNYKGDVMKVAVTPYLYGFIFIISGCQTASQQSPTDSVEPGQQKVLAVTGNSSAKKSTVHKSDDSGLIKALTPRLDAWREGSTKQRIKQFVSQSVNKKHRHYVPVNERFAVFDLDGSLWVEYPNKPMLGFIRKELAKQLHGNPNLKAQQPWKAVAENDPSYFKQLNSAALYRTLLKAHAGRAQRVYNNDTKLFLNDAKHPRFNRSYLKLAYKPMKEFINYLYAHQYKVYIVAGTETAFVRSFSEQVFNIPVEQVIGSTAMMEWDKQRVRLVRRNAFVSPVNDYDGKPVNIERYMGRRPVIAVGNADGDIAMLDYTARRKGASLVMVVKHDDARREYSYSVGAEKLLLKAEQRSWVLISMKQDFKELF